MKNPDLHLDLSKINYKKVPRFIGRYVGFAVGIILLSLLGYTGYQISRVLSVTPDEGYVAEEIKKTDAKRIKLDTKTLEAVRSLNHINVAPDTSNPGKGDPFTP
jgi:hypothetical protein